MTQQKAAAQPRPIGSARAASPENHGDVHEQAYNAYVAEGKTRGEAFDLMLAYVARIRAAKRAGVQS